MPGKFRRFLWLLWLICTGLADSALAQSADTLRVDFLPDKRQPGILDHAAYPQWNKEYQKISVYGQPYLMPYVAVAPGTRDTIDFVFRGAQPGRLKFRVQDSVYYLRMRRLSGDTFSLVLPALKGNYDLEVLYRNELSGKLRVVKYRQKPVSVILVRMVSDKVNTDSLAAYLNQVYGPANIRFSVSQKDLFVPENAPDLFSNPSPQNDRYTEQMRQIRDEYFRRHKREQAYYLFLVEGFVNPEVLGYTVRNKAVGFVKYDQEDLFRSIAQQLGLGAGAFEYSWIDDGPPQGTTDNLMDVGEGVRMTFGQWEGIQRNVRTLSYFDDYEKVYTNSGQVACYFWEEDENGNILMKDGNFASAITHPFKRNQFSLHLNIDNWLFVPLFSISPYDINSLHLLSLVFLFMFSVILRRKFSAWLASRIRLFRPFRWMIRGLFFGTTLVLYVGLFLLINLGYILFEVDNGELEYLQGMDMDQAVAAIRENENTARLAEKEPGSEVVIHRGENWFLEKHRKVLYFEITGKGEEWTTCRFKGSSDTLSLVTKEFRDVAASHYYVFSYRGKDGRYVMQKVFNHTGSEISDKLNIQDPARRILLFVNGYRPTSLGKTFEENFKDIQKHGLEYPNSANLLYRDDRFQYWSQWNQMDTRFKKRINPSEVYYADGHFSVATSNHGSLINFTTLSTSYPHRCREGHHVCQTTEVKDWYFFSSEGEQPTASLLDMPSNKKGFEERRTNGRIAGRNLEMMLNELPNLSENDTLYIVAHSMGYAYSLGIVDQLRGKINFGGLYIIAPENAGAGNIDVGEWQEVWQFGSNTALHAKGEPCLLDGIAPQVKVGGLPGERRIFIPEKYYRRMGFFDSHFIGYYTWIFDIPEGQKGYIRQR